ETGVNYNFFRDYDPTVGRYVESDPIGLAGGVNTYRYTGDNPEERTDPYGLWPFGAGLIPGAPSQAQATAQISQALQKLGVPPQDAAKYARDITDEAEWGDISAAQAMQKALQQGEKLTKDQCQDIQKFISRLPKADQGPLNNLFNKYAPSQQ
ncbi:MAG TPA: RHS repeat-associated core domain-containing protein, partial [Stellaceae bacterium]|nr:RHS repeat-associated core domain-containing protein [Stellaceae bacterium]